MIIRHSVNKNLFWQVGCRYPGIYFFRHAALPINRRPSSNALHCFTSKIWRVPHLNTAYSSTLKCKYEYRQMPLVYIATQTLPKAQYPRDISKLQFRYYASTSKSTFRIYIYWLITLRRRKSLFSYIVFHLQGDLKEIARPKSVIYGFPCLKMVEIKIHYFNRFSTIGLRRSMNRAAFQCHWDLGQLFHARTLSITIWLTNEGLVWLSRIIVKQVCI